MVPYELYGGYPDPVEAYAAQIKRFSKNGRLLAAVSQDPATADPHRVIAPANRFDILTHIFSRFSQKVCDFCI